MLTDKSSKGAFNDAAKPIDIPALIAERTAYNEAKALFDAPKAPQPPSPRPGGEMGKDADRSDAGVRAQREQELQEWDVSLTRRERRAGLAFPTPPPAAPAPVSPGAPTLSDEFNKSSRR